MISLTSHLFKVLVAPFAIKSPENLLLFNDKLVKVQDVILLIDILCIITNLGGVIT